MTEDMKRSTHALSIVACVCILSSCTTTESVTTGEPVDTSVSSLKTTRAADKAKSPYTKYPFDYCAVIRTPFSQRPVKHRRVYKGQEVLFCCTPCVKAFDSYPEAYIGYIVAASGHTLQ
jgi:YHS domain-containing protein